MDASRDCACEGAADAKRPTVSPRTNAKANLTSFFIEATPFDGRGHRTSAAVVSLISSRIGREYYGPVDCPFDDRYDAGPARRTVRRAFQKSNGKGDAWGRQGGPGERMIGENSICFFFATMLRCAARFSTGVRCPGPPLLVPAVQNVRGWRRNSSMHGPGCSTCGGYAGQRPSRRRLSWTGWRWPSPGPKSTQASARGSARQGAPEKAVKKG